MAVLIILSTLALPALNGVLSGAGVRSASSQMANLFEQARAAALARSSYVYVGLKQLDDQTVVVALSSPPNGDADIANATLLRPPMLLQNVELRDGAQVQEQVPILSAAANADHMADFDIGGLHAIHRGESIQFDHVVQWSPNGQATVKQGNASRYIQIGIAPAQRPESRNLSLIQIAGLTGNVTVYVP